MGSCIANFLILYRLSSPTYSSFMIRLIWISHISICDWACERAHKTWSLFQTFMTHNYSLWSAITLKCSTLIKHLISYIMQVTEYKYSILVLSCHVAGCTLYPHTLFLQAWHILVALRFIIFVMTFPVTHEPKAILHFHHTYIMHLSEFAKVITTIFIV